MSSEYYREGFGPVTLTPSSAQFLGLVPKVRLFILFNISGRWIQVSAGSPAVGGPCPPAHQRWSLRHCRAYPLR